MRPNLLVIGAMKSGTSSLHSYLSHHPEIFMSTPKELDFFVIEKNWERGIAWYESHFPEASPIIGESSTTYTKYPKFKNVPERMDTVLSNPKLIYLARDPVARIVSHYLHMYLRREETRSFESAVLNSQSTYIQYSRYFMQLEKYLEYFPLTQILVLCSEDLDHRRAATLKRVFEFLQVDSSFFCSHFYQRRNETKGCTRATWLKVRLKNALGFGRVERAFPRFFSRTVTPPVLSDRVRETLAEILRPDVEKLRALTGQSFSDWSL